ncbi:MAG: choloylglycine hydrolase family protein [Deltaproteobacteria bacterium]|nr:choloylglycine hydrolase family protein [Deltaproteobacteria bacterium]
MRIAKLSSALLALSLFLALSPAPAPACTGLRLVAQNGATVYGRTMEWGTFDLNSRVAIIPRGYAFTGLTPQGANGKSWKARYGVVALDMLHRDVLADGMNEKGLAAGMFYHPGFAKYPAYDPAQAADTITAADVLAYILTQFATLAEVKAGMAGVRVVGVEEKAIGGDVPAHWMVVEPSGQALVIEYLDGRLHLFDDPVGVITNAPGFGWHLTNLRNYVNLSPVALPAKKLDDLNFAPLGAGSGMIGLPGDNTPPSRFIRAVAWTQTARPLPDSREAVYEVFRILDNFNLPLGAAEGSGDAAQNLAGMRSSTIWTTAWDQGNRVLYYHTQHNRRVRKVDMKRLVFVGQDIIHLDLDVTKAEDVEDITPAP